MPIPSHRVANSAMKVFALPHVVKAFLFDIDGTLYTSDEYVAEQVDVQLRHLARVRGIGADEVRDMVAAYRAKWSADHGGAKISLGNTLVAFGVSIEESVAWRNELLHPEDYLTPDDDLTSALERLATSYKLVCVTNNPVQAARRTLRAVGIEDYFCAVVGLDTCFKSKPAKELLTIACQKAACLAHECVAVGDRYDIDLDLPLKMGMGAVLVAGAEDVVSLCQMFV